MLKGLSISIKQRCQSIDEWFTLMTNSSSETLNYISTNSQIKTTNFENFTNIYLIPKQQEMTNIQATEIQENYKNSQEDLIKEKSIYNYEKKMQSCLHSMLLRN